MQKGDSADEVWLLHLTQISLRPHWDLTKIPASCKTWNSIKTMRRLVRFRWDISEVPKRHLTRRNPFAQRISKRLSKL